MPANVFTIAASAPFAETLARGLVERLDAARLALADSVIYLPTRRAARTFGDAFARVLGGATLLPQFKALGDVDDEEMLFDAGDDELELPPAIAPIRRRLLLTTMIRHWRADVSYAQASSLAASLARAMDELDTQNARYDELATEIPAALAEHWFKVQEFLDLLRTEWPKLLAAEGTINPAMRRNLALQALAKRLADKPPNGMIIAAGSTGSIPATAELMRTIANLPRGAVVLPGLDRVLDEASWRELDAGHPQFGLKQLLERIDVARAGVRDWNDAREGGRERALREVLRPAPTTDAWRNLVEHGEASEIARGLEGLALIEAADPAEEALVVALILREALEEKGKSAALVTLDRTLARRVASELARWSVAVDDSAGRPLSHTPPGTFLSLLADAADTAFAPVPLLAFLKHPLCTLGQDRGAFRYQVRVLDRQLRGPRPDAGLDGIRMALERRRQDASEAAQARLSELQYWFAELAEALRPLEGVFSRKSVDLAEAFEIHLAVAVKFAGDALWAGDTGASAAQFVDELRSAAQSLTPIDPRGYAALFRALAENHPVRPNREGRHPRVSILGPLEARLQSFDTLVLGGLNEGTWPRATGADPWFSRPMRRVIGLEQPERSIGQAAHDIWMLAAGKRVLLTRALKSEGVPTVASRWLQRLQQLTSGLGLKSALEPTADYVAMARSLIDAGEVQRMKRPAPTPPVEARPRELPITDIETWVRDPYAIYAKRILRLRTLDPLDAEIGALERGSAVHKALEIFLRRLPGELPADAALQLIAIADEVFATQGTPKAALALWRPRFVNAAVWFVSEERRRRQAIVKSYAEIEGRLAVDGGFEIYGRADRIDIATDGHAEILDYKTGGPPTPSQIGAFLAPQLLLEGAMMRKGAFGELGKREVDKLLYLRFSGGREPGAIQSVDTNLIDEAAARLNRRIADFSVQATPYLPRVKPYRVDVPGDYDHLSRVREWSLSGWEDEDE